MTASLSKGGRDGGAGEYYLQGHDAYDDNYSQKHGAWHGPSEVLERLGVKPGDTISPEIWRCVIRGIDPKRASVAFHPGGEFNAPAYVTAAWEEATPGQRQQILKDLKAAGVRTGKASVGASGAYINDLITRSLASLAAKPKDQEALATKIFRAAHRVEGFALVQGAGPGRQTGYDITMTMPKDVSVLWARADAETRKVIDEVVRDAANKGVLDYLNAHVNRTRAGKGGESDIGCQYIGAAFLDYVGRPVDLRGTETDLEKLGLSEALGTKVDGVFVDPHEHIHFFIPNTVLCDDGKFRALDGQRIYQAQGAMGEAFHAAIAAGLKERLGIRVEKNEAGVAFTLPDVPREAVEEFKKRTQIINAKKNELGLGGIPNAQLGRELWDTIKLSTREKHVTLTNEQLNEHWEQRLDAVGFTKSDVQRILDEGRQRITEGYVDNVPSANQVKEVIEELLETESAFSDHKLRAAVLGRFTASCKSELIIDRVNQVIENETVRLGEFDKRETLTTVQMMTLEARYVDIAKHGRHHSSISGADIEAAIKAVNAIKQKDGKSVSAEQADAARYLLGGDSIVRVMEGPAGAGKTFTLEIVQNCLEKAGYTTVAAAISWSASEQLKAEGGMSAAAAIAKLAHDIKTGAVQLDDKTCLVLDEGSLIGSRDMGVILTAAQDAGSKVIITGDTEQIQSVGAGAAMRLIVENTGSFQLEEVRRQKEAWDRKAGLDIRAGGDRLVDGMKAHDEHGRITVESTADDAVQALFERWQQDRKADPQKTQLMIAKTNEHVDALNVMARASLHEAGMLGKDHEIEVSRGKRVDSMRIAEGDFIQFREKSSDLLISNKSGEAREGQVFNRTRASILKINTDHSGTVTSIDVELYSGDKRTGDTVTIRPESFKGGRFSLEPAYAVTPDSSQGMTVDKCYVLPGGLDRARGYVALSRHREDLQMFISRDEMHQQAARFMDRTKFSALNKDGYVDRNDFTDQMAKEALTVQLQRNAGKKTTLDYVAAKSQVANQSCLAGTRFETLVRTDEALAKTWANLGSIQENIRRQAVAASDASAFAKRFKETLISRSIETAVASLKRDGASILPTQHLPSHLPKEFTHEADLRLTPAAQTVGKGRPGVRLDTQDGVRHVSASDLDQQRRRDIGQDGPAESVLPPDAHGAAETVSVGVRRPDPGAATAGRSQTESAAEPVTQEPAVVKQEPAVEVRSRSQKRK